MYKIALTGKANTGKNTAANIIKNNLIKMSNGNLKNKILAFADPIKEIIKIMFPFINQEWLYGSSKLRSNVINGAKDSNGNPLTIRQCLIDIGTKIGRGYSNTVWLENFEFRFQNEIKNNTKLIIISDVRFPNEFEYLKKKDFYMIRIVRDTDVKINHSSETTQDLIADEQFDFVIDNNFDLENLKNLIKDQVVTDICKKQGVYV